mmetsp:Transcript_6781/g.16275  ORF Transcript_6781/g.16275 Transcript_6781/m.16275 type:complete len:207 (+) Transcript_6781:323-943(+)
MYEMSTSAPGATSVRAQMESLPSPMTVAAALGVQSWLCQPTRAERAQPAFLPFRCTWHALVRTIEMSAPASLEVTPVSEARVASWERSRLTGLRWSEVSAVVDSLSVDHSPTSGCSVTRKRSSSRSTEVSTCFARSPPAWPLPPLALGGRAWKARHSCPCHSSRPALTQPVHAQNLAHPWHCTRLGRDSTAGTPAPSPSFSHAAFS